MLIALTRRVSPAIGRCELTHLEREPIDYTRSVDEHERYEAALTELGCCVKRLPELPDHPDSVFVEDAAVVFDDFAVIARPGAASRRGEVATVIGSLQRYRRLEFIEAPGTLDGGDVLVTRTRVFVGIGGRTNPAGVRQLAAIVATYGFDTIGVPLAGCLHLKSAVTLAAGKPVSGVSDLGSGTLVVNPEWVDVAAFKNFDVIEVDPSEPHAANVLCIGDTILCASEHPRTRARLQAAGLRSVPVPAGELAKAEGGLTCRALIVQPSKTDHP
jgi:dimethylargininase